MKYILFLTTLFLSGCVAYSPSIPAGYTGPKALIKDSVMIHSGSKSDFFVVRRVDGKEIENSIVESRVENRGRGFSLTPLVLDREIPARPVTLHIQGRTEYAAPILALTNAVYEVKGDVTFTPAENKTYVVTGTLGEQYSAVWVQDSETGAAVSEKVEVKGSAKLGFLQK